MIGTIGALPKTVSEQLASHLSDLVVTSAPLLDAIVTRTAETMRADEDVAVYTYLAGTGDMNVASNGQVDVVARLVAYVRVPKVGAPAKMTKGLEIVETLLSRIPFQRWGFTNAHPAVNVEAADLHGLVKGFKPDTSSWRLGVSVLARAADLYGADNPDERLGLWAVTWEQALRIGDPAEMAGEGIEVIPFPNEAELWIYRAHAERTDDRLPLEGERAHR